MTLLDPPPELIRCPDRLRAAVEALMEAHRIPGLSMAVVSRDRLLYAAGFGDADIASATRASAVTAYPWFSMSKLVTATAVLTLVDRGALDLAADASDYVACLAASGGFRPTIRQLLDHTAGLANPLPLRWVHADGSAAPDPGALLGRLMRGRRAYRRRPGTAARYSNVGYLALGQILSRVTGMPFERYVQRAVLEPTGMRQTGYSYGPDARAATGYVAAPRPADPLLRAMLPAGVAGRRTGRHIALNRFYVDGPAYGGLIGHVLDAARFLRMHLADGQIDGQRVLAPGTAARMRQISQAGRPFAHGLGWFQRPGPGPSSRVEHFGAGIGFWNVMRLYPDERVGVALMTNSTAAYDFEPLMAEVVRATCS